MAVSAPVLLAARNAFLFVLLALVGVSTYQFATTGGITPAVAVVWVVGVGSFYASKWYYGRQEKGSGGESGDGDGAPSTGE